MAHLKIYIICELLEPVERLVLLNQGGNIKIMGRSPSEDLIVAEARGLEQ